MSRSSVACVRAGVIVVAALLAAVAASQPARAAGAVVDLDPAATQANVGDTFTVTVRAHGVSSFGAYEFILDYDANVLDYQGAGDAGFLGSTGRHPACRDESTLGQVVYACNTSGHTTPGASGDGDLTLLQFKAAANGTSSLHFAKIGLAVIDGDSIDLADCHEAVVQVGASAQSDTPATPTKVPGAVTPTVVPGATRQPGLMLSDATAQASGGGAYAAATPAPGGVVAPAESRQPSGATAGSESDSMNASNASSGFPVAGTGPSHQENQSPWKVALLLGFAGVLSLAFGSMLARRRP